MSTLDYGIVPADIFENISLFYVGSYLPFISDHCPIFFEIQATMEKKIREPKLKDAPKFFKIKIEDHEKLLDALKYPEIDNVYVP